MPSIRPQRVAEQIRELLSGLLRRDLRDTRLANVSVTEVEITPDLRLATVHFSVFPGDEPERMAAEQALERARGLLRRAIATELRLRSVPDLRFRHDRRAQYAAHIDQVLHEVGALHAAPGDEAGCAEPCGRPEPPPEPPGE